MSELVKVSRNDLTIREKNITNQLPQSYRELVVLRQEAPISRISDKDLTAHCLDVIAVSYSESTPNGQPDPNILAFQAGQLKSELHGKFSQLTISEVKEAFKRGVRGDAGQWFGMCARTYHQFLKWFYNLPERQEGWMKYTHLLSSDSDHQGKDIPVNPEGQKRVIEILKNTLSEMQTNQESRVKKQHKPIEKSPRDHFIQKCLREFDDLFDKVGLPMTGRYIEYNGVPMDVTDYTQEKLKEYDNKLP